MREDRRDGRYGSRARVVGAVLLSPDPAHPDAPNAERHESRGEAALVFIASRKPPTFTGSFIVSLNLTFDPAAAAADYPSFTGAATINVDLNDGTNGTVTLTNVEQVTTTGRISPTVYLSGHCRVASTTGTAPILGCRYWLMMADNTPDISPASTPDVIGFLVIDKTGKRVAYGTGPVKSGTVVIAPTSN